MKKKAAPQTKKTTTAKSSSAPTKSAKSVTKSAKPTTKEASPRAAKHSQVMIATGALPSLWWKWLLLIFGLILILVGIVLLFNPIEALVAITAFIGFCLLFGGVANIVAYFGSHGVFSLSGWILAEGIVSVFLSLLILRNPGIAGATLLFLVGAWFLIAGLIRIINAINMARRHFPNWGWTLFFGIVLLLLGALSFYTPIFNLIAISLFIGLYFIFSGVVNLVEFAIVDRLDYRRNKVLQQILKK